MTTMSLELGSVFNFRDLGGLRTTHGQRIRPRQLYRADGLHRLDRVDTDRLLAIGVRTVIDLRTLSELEEAPSIVHPYLEVVHLPVLERTWTDGGGILDDGGDAVAFLRARYAEMLVEGSTALAAAVEMLASPARRPAVFHCAAGKDRTGVLAALVLEVLGVAHDVIAADYARTAEAMARMLAWLEVERPDVVETMAAQPASLLACPPEAMRAFLDDLALSHGGAEAFLRASGVGPGALGALRSELLEPAND